MYGAVAPLPVKVTIGCIAFKQTFIAPAMAAFGKGFTVIAVICPVITLKQAWVLPSCTCVISYVNVPAVVVGTVNVATPAALLTTGVCGMPLIV